MRALEGCFWGHPNVMQKVNRVVLNKGTNVHIVLY